jgi:hypothetical protein
LQRSLYLEQIAPVNHQSIINAYINGVQHYGVLNFEFFPPTTKQGKTMLLNGSVTPLEMIAWGFLFFYWG